MVRQFYLLSFVLMSLVAAIGYFYPQAFYIYYLLVPVFLVGVNDSLQTRHGVRRNFPVIGNLRYFFELIRPELQQYFVESNHSGRPVPRELRSVVYQRAKGQLQSLPFGTQQDLYAEGQEWVEHSIAPTALKLEDFRHRVGGKDCLQPYSASLLNISAMSYGSLSPNAVSALNRGAKAGGFYHNTGEGGLSPYHLLGGDVVWQIGTGYFGCRNEQGLFDADKFQQKTQNPNIKMIEIKLSQGAKPGKGGILPAAKVSPEIAEIRGVPMGKDVISPAYHTAFSSPLELVQFIDRLRKLSAGKPIGFKLCIGRKSEFIAIVKAMLKTGVYPDFITVDGAEGGTGAAPLEFSNSVGLPLEEGLVFVDDVLTGFGLRDGITVIASGMSFTAFHMLKRLCLGADMVNSARGMMMALGCIQALKCNSNHCPVGVATTDPRLARGLHVSEKSQRVARYHHETLYALTDLISAMGLHSPDQLRRAHVFRRRADRSIHSLEEVFPSLTTGALLNKSHLPVHWQKLLDEANVNSFHPQSTTVAA